MRLFTRQRERNEDKFSARMSDVTHHRPALSSCGRFVVFLLTPYTLMFLPAVFAADSNLLLWNGETSCTYEFGSENTLAPFRGNVCFEGVPDAYHEPRIILNGLSSWRADISGYDEIWFFARCDQTGKTFDFTVTGYPNISNKVNITPYIQGGMLDTSYRLVRIPISVLKTATYTLNNVENLRFGLATPSVGHKIYIDEIWAIKLSVADPASTPLIWVLPPIDFGGIDVATAAHRTINVTNIGYAALHITGARLEGTDAGSFSIDSSAFSLQPGQTGSVAVDFAPLSPGQKSANAVLTHNGTVLGNESKIPLRGMANGPAIVLSVNSLQFGTVPLGSSATWDLTVSNPGNENLNVSSIVNANPAFVVTPASFIVPPGGHQDIAAAFSPVSAGAQEGVSTLYSDDPVHGGITLAMAGAGIPADGTAAKLKVLAGPVTSASIPLIWPRFSGIDEVRVFLGAEPAAAPDTMFPNAMLVAALPATAPGYVVENLPASVHVFLHVEARAGGNTVAAGNVHARMTGGAGAALATPLRQAHLSAPNIVELVLANPAVQSYSGTSGSLAGYTGTDWQNGTWSVARHDNTPIAVSHVYRHSIPVGQTNYELGYGTSTHDNIVDVDHHIYLVLGEPVGSGEVLRIQGPLGLDTLLPFSDRYLETPVIQLNQVGYNPRATRRFAYVSGWLGDGGPLSMADFPAAAEVLAEPEDPEVPRTAVVTGLPITARAAADGDAGTEVREINLASVPAAEGTVYRVRIPGVGVSWPTQVSETAAFKAFFTAARGLYYNRWGRVLKPECTPWGPRPADHPTVHPAELFDEEGDPIFGFGPDARFPEDTPITGERPLSGGHHNAGDFDVQLSDHVVGMMLLRLFDINPAAYTDGQLMIPESGNGVPDILDEALWNLRAWEQLQESDGGVRAGVESWREPWGIYYADEDPLPYWTYSRHTMHSLRVAGLFAQASRLVAPFNALKAGELRERAIRAYDYAVAHGADEHSRGPMLYGAGELFRLTGLQKYADMFTATWIVEDKYGLGPGMYAYLPDVSSYYDPVPYLIPDHLLGYIMSPSANPTYVSQIRTKLSTMAGNAVTAVDTLHAHRNGRDPNQSPALGKGTAVGEYVMSVYARAQMGGIAPSEWQTYFDAMSLSADYVLGANPEGRVWLTGLGSQPPRDPLHLDSLTFIKEGGKPIPGYPVFGPTKGLSGLYYYDYGEYVFYPAFLDHPLMHRYADIHTFVANNEGLSQLMAIHTELFGMLVAPGVMPKPSWLPSGTEQTDELAPRESVLPESVPGQLAFTTQPQGAHRYLDEGDYTLEAGTAGGDGAVTYAWIFDNGVDSAVAGSGTSCVIHPPALSKSGAYYCVAADSAGTSVASDIAYVFFYERMSVSNPAGGEVDSGGSWTFSVNVEGGRGVLSYQWQFENSDKTVTLVGSNSPTLTIAPATFRNEGDYYVAVSDEWTTSVSDTAHLSVRATVPMNHAVAGIVAITLVCAILGTRWTRRSTANGGCSRGMVRDVG